MMFFILAVSLCSFMVNKGMRVPIDILNQGRVYVRACVRACVGGAGALAIEPISN